MIGDIGDRKTVGAARHLQLEPKGQKVSKFWKIRRFGYAENYSIQVMLPLFFWKTSCFYQNFRYCWFSHDVTKIQTKKLSILPRFYFHDTLEQLKTNFHTNYCFKRVLGFVIEYALISKLLRDVALTWRPRELSCSLKKRLISGNFAI